MKKHTGVTINSVSRIVYAIDKRGGIGRKNLNSPKEKSDILYRTLAETKRILSIK